MFNTSEISSNNLEKLSLLADKHLWTFLLFKFPDLQSHGRQISIDLVFTREKKLGLGLGQSSPAMLPTPNSFNSEEPVPEAKEVVAT